MRRYQQKNKSRQKSPSENANGDRSGHFVEHLDKNNDGKVSRSEFDGPPDAFDRHDRNHDGFLTEDEAPPPPGQGM